MRTMFETNKAAQIARERRAYNITVLELCETRWTQSGQVRLNTGEMILYSGHEEEDAHHTEGVALMLSHEAQNALINWEAAGPRIIYASNKTKKENIKLNIIQCYAPTNDKDEETKEVFYNKLQTLCDKLKEKDMTILMGELNAKIGSDNSGYEEVMGRQGLGRMNENGEMLADFCAFNNMIIGGSVCPHRRIHKATWVSPDHRTENQIDHICIGRKFRRSMQDVRVQRCSLRPPSSAGQNEDEAKEERSQAEHQNPVQCGLPTGQGDNRDLPTYSQKQIRSPTRYP